MSLFRKGGTAIAIATMVLSLGYLVQSGGTSSSPREVRKANPPPASSVRSVMMSKTSTGASVFGVPGVTSQPLPQVETIQTIASIDATLAEMETPDSVFMLGSPMDSCKTTIDAVPHLAAMVELTVNSPCHVEADFVIWHDRVAFSGLTDDAGNAVLKAPVLQVDAQFIVTFDNLEEARTSVTVPDANQYDRVVLHWRGSDNLQLHALEFDATFGDPGHIWSASTQSAELAQQGERGFMVRLGTSEAEIPYWVEIYTYPSGLGGRDGQVALQVGAAVTNANCGRAVDAMGLQVNAAERFVSRDMAIQMPGCDAVGQSVMHANMFDQTRVAER